MNFIKQHKTISVVLLLDLIVAIIIGILVIQRFKRASTLQVLVAPTDAKVTINGKQYQNNGTYEVEPGELYVKVEYDGLVSKEFSLVAVADKTTKVYAYLVGENNDFSIYESNMAELDLLKRVGQDKEAGDFLQRMSIINILPYKYDVFDEATMTSTTFRIDVDRIDCPDRFCLQAVNQRNSSRELMKQKVLEKGYNLNDYEVFYF